MLFKHEMQVDKEINIDNYVVPDMSAKIGIDIIQKVGKREEIQTASLYQQIELTVHAYHPDKIRQIKEVLQGMIDSESYNSIIAAREIGKLLDLI